MKELIIDYIPAGDANGAQVEVRSLPWELMRDTDRGYLAQKAYSFVRSRPEVPITPLPLDTDNVINILMII